MNGNWFEFVAIQGIQARSAFFVVMVPLKIVPKFFKFDDETLPPALRAQRVLNKARVPLISHYITENPEEYILSSLCASVDGEVYFEPLLNADGTNTIGKLKISMTATVLINDGQHIGAAIEEAIRERAYLGDETISVVLYIDKGLARSQQMFADLNIHAIRPTKSLKLLYNHRDENTHITKQVIEKIDLFVFLLILKKTSISNRSLKLFTFSAIHQATMELLGKPNKNALCEKKISLAINFWSEVISNMPDWQCIQSRDAVAADLRREYIHAHGIALQAIAKTGNYLLEHHPLDWSKYLKHLRIIDWSRTNLTLWNGRALVAGKINKSRNNVILVSNLIQKTMGINLTEDAQVIENMYLSSSLNWHNQAQELA